VTAVALQQSDLESTQVAHRTYLTRRRAPRLDAALVLSAMICLLMLIPSHLILPGMTDIGRPALVVCMLIFSWWVMVRLTPHLTLPGPQPIRWALLGFALSILASYAVAQLRALTSIEANGADKALLFMAAFAGAALGAADGIPNWSRLQTVIKVLVFCGTVMAVIGIIQFAFAVDVTKYLTIPGLESKGIVIGFEDRGAGIRVASTATHYIELATVLATVLPFAIHLALFSDGRRRRTLYVISALLIAGGVMTTISRSGVLAVGIVAVVLIPIWTWRLRYNILFLVTVLGAGLAAAKPGLTKTLTSLFDDPSTNPAFTVRSSRYPMVWAFVAQHPLLGRGTGTYIYPQYIILDNQWLAFLISNGIVGVVAMAAMHLTGIVLALLSMRRAVTPEARHLGAVLVSTQIIALAVAGTYDSLSFFTYATLVALTLGMCGAVWRLTHPARLVRTATPRWFIGSRDAHVAYNDRR
jgi:hypothetical protein